ncbi:S8 family serine peptidase [Aliikangiella sp. IMCC44632]
MKLVKLSHLKKFSTFLALSTALILIALSPFKLAVAADITKLNTSGQITTPPLTLPQPKVPLKTTQNTAVTAITDKATLQQLELKSIADDPLNIKSQVMPILDSLGNVAFNEVLVENNHRAVAQEWLILLNPTELKFLKSLNIEVIKSKQYFNSDLQLIQFKVPLALDSWQALKQVLPQHLLARLDRNHIYEPQKTNNNDQRTSHSAKNRTSNHSQLAVGCASPVKIGMIDTSINLQHSALVNQRIILKNFVNSNITVPIGHGTIIAGVLKANSNHVTGLLPNAQLFAASAFYSRNDYTQGANLMSIVSALDWLSSNQVTVINMSLTGPKNNILERFIKRLSEREIIIVAAAGNQGPASPPLYPAAYPSVIAVTAVDHNHEVYRWANQGEHIDFSAYGVNQTSLHANGKYSLESGTSLAVPVVAATLACELHHSSAKKALKRLQENAIDLGETGHDPIFGHGLIKSHNN